MPLDFRTALFTAFIGLTVSIVVAIISSLLDGSQGRRTRHFTLAVSVIIAVFSSAAAVGLVFLEIRQQTATGTSTSPTLLLTTAVVPTDVQPNAPALSPTVLLPTGQQSLSPSGMIAFAGQALGRADHDIYIVGFDGVDAHPLLNEPGYDDVAPAWSPDGQQITFLRAEVSARQLYQIYIMSVNDPTPVPVSAGDGDHGTPSWSPDGRYLAYSFRPEGGNWDICLVDLQAGDNKNLTRDNEGLDINPSWSPNGDQIVFERVDRDGIRGLYVINIANPTDSVRTLPVDNLDPRGPKWSPDGNWIAFVANRRNEDESDLYIIQADGTLPINLGYTSKKEHIPAWSPDSRFIAYHSDGNPRTILCVALDTPQIRIRVVTALADSYWPAWSPR